MQKEDLSAEAILCCQHLKRVLPKGKHKSSEDLEILQVFLLFIKMIALVLWHIFFTRAKFLNIVLKTQFALRSIKLISMEHTLNGTSEVSHHLVWICVMNA